MNERFYNTIKQVVSFLDPSEFVKINPFELSENAIKFLKK